MDVNEKYRWAAVVLIAAFVCILLGFAGFYETTLKVEKEKTIQLKIEMEMKKLDKQVKE